MGIFGSVSLVIMVVCLCVVHWQPLKRALVCRRKVVCKDVERNLEEFERWKLAQDITQQIEQNLTKKVCLVRNAECVDNQCCINNASSILY